MATHEPPSKGPFRVLEEIYQGARVQKRFLPQTYVLVQESI